MATEAQIRANRSNAQKSTGPRTPEGKAKSARNATKHGLTAQHIVLSTEDQEVYDAHREQMLAERIISLSWRLDRAVRIQTQRRNAGTREQHALPNPQNKPNRHPSTSTRVSSRASGRVEGSPLRLDKYAKQTQRNRPILCRTGRRGQGNGACPAPWPPAKVTPPARTPPAGELQKPQNRITIDSHNRSAPLDLRQNRRLAGCVSPIACVSWLADGRICV